MQGPSNSIRWQLLLLVVLVGGLTILGYQVKMDLATLEALLETYEGLGVIGIVCFGVVYCLVATLPIPLMPITAVGGYAMGFWTGLICLWPAAVFSSVLSHWFGERFVEGRLHLILERFPKAKTLCDAAARTGWKSVAANRLLPVCPFAVQNMLLGAVGVRKRDQALGTAIGILPASLFALYCGSVTQELATALTTPEQALPMGRVVLIAVAGVVLLTILLWARYVLKNTITDEVIGG